MAAARDPDGAPRFALPARFRIKRAREFERVYAAGLGRRTGPLAVHARPNGLAHSRLGLSVPARAGGAVVRNRIKRLLREAFRRHRHELPAAYDVVIGVRAHRPLAADEYGRLLLEAMRGIHRTWTKRHGSSGGGGDASG